MSAINFSSSTAGSIFGTSIPELSHLAPSAATHSLGGFHPPVDGVDQPQVHAMHWGPEDRRSDNLIDCRGLRPEECKKVSDDFEKNRAKKAEPAPDTHVDPMGNSTGVPAPAPTPSPGPSPAPKK